MRVHVRSSFVRWCSNPFRNASSVRRSGRPTGRGRHTHTAPPILSPHTRRPGPAPPSAVVTLRGRDGGVRVWGLGGERAAGAVRDVRTFVRSVPVRPAGRAWSRVACREPARAPRPALVDSTSSSARRSETRQQQASSRGGRRATSSRGRP